MERGLDDAVAGAEVFVQQLEHSVAGVGLAGAPIQQCDGRKLAGIAEELGGAQHVDALFGEAGVEIREDCAAEVPILRGWKLSGVRGTLCEVVCRDAAGFVDVGLRMGRETLANALDIADGVKERVGSASDMPTKRVAGVTACTAVTMRS